MVDDVKRIDPIEGLMATFRVVASGDNSHRKDVFNDVVGDTIVDTVKAHDTGMWETGIKRGEGKWVIVQQYKSRDEAQVRHKDWVDEITKHPKTELTDINLWGL